VTNGSPDAATARSSILRRSVLEIATPWPQMPPVHLVDFDGPACLEADFDGHGVTLPDSLSRAVPKRRIEFLAGRLAAHAALGSMGVFTPNIGIGPFRQPIWPKGTIGSISHNRSLAVAVAAPSAAASGIGIDVESVDPDHARAIEAAGAVDADETALAAELGEGIERSAAVTLIFSAKESFFKGVFGAVGAYFGFDAVRIVSIKPAEGRLALELTTDLSDRLPLGRRFEIAFTRLRPRTVLTAFLW
jgi:enterobactin synthetase component D